MAFACNTALSDQPLVRAIIWLERLGEFGGAFDHGLGCGAGRFDRFENLAVEREHAELDRHEAEIGSVGDNDALGFTGN